jgi:predicted ATPase
LTLVQQHEHDYSLALARCHIATMYQVSGDFSAMQEMATAAMALATEKGFPYCLACSTIQYGWARAMQTRGREGIEQLSQGIAAYQATGAALWQAHFLSLLADAQLVAGQTSACLHTVTEGLTLAHARGQFLAEADLYRIKGDLLLAQKGRSQKSKTPDSEREAEEYFLRALEIARAQQARTLECRVALRLGRLWLHRGKIDSARQTLTSLCERFGGEPSTTDLQEVQLLLRSFHEAD